MRLSFGPFVIDSRTRAVTRNGARVEISPKAFLLLEALIEARPAPVSKEALYDRLWPDTFVEAGNLHNLIAEIRRVLDDSGHTIVRTIHGVGYSFDAGDVALSTSDSRFLLWIGEEVVHLRSGENIIGRDPDSTIVIDSPDVSRQHARIFVADDHVTIEDLGSKNGTFVGTVRIEKPRVVRAPAEIVIGKTRMEIRMRGSIATTVTAK